MVHFDSTLLSQSLLKDEATSKIPFFFHKQLLQFFSPFLFPGPVLTKPFHDNIFPSKIDPRVPTSVPKKPLSYLFVLFSIVSVTPFSKISECPVAWIIFIITFISSFEVIEVIVPEPCFFLFLHQLLLQLLLFLMEPKYFLWK